MPAFGTETGRFRRLRTGAKTPATPDRLLGGFGLAGALALLVLRPLPADAQSLPVLRTSPPLATLPVSRLVVAPAPRLAPNVPSTVVLNPTVSRPLPVATPALRINPALGQTAVIDAARVGPSLSGIRVIPTRPLTVDPDRALPGSPVRSIDPTRLADPTLAAARPGGATAMTPVTGSTARAGGLAAFVSPGARGYGAVSARLGRVALRQGKAVTVDLYGDRLIQLAVADGSRVAAALPDQPPSGDRAASASRLATGGDSIALTVGTANSVVDGVINMAGKTEARGVEIRNGRIVLVGDPPSFGAAAVAPKGGGADSTDYLDPTGPNGGPGSATEGVTTVRVWGDGRYDGDSEGDADAGAGSVPGDAAAPGGDWITRIASWLAAQRGQVAASMDTDSGRPARLIDLTPIQGLGLWITTTDALALVAPAAGGGGRPDDPALAALRETCPDVTLASMAWQSTPSESAFNAAPEMVPYSADVYCGGYKVTSAARGAFSTYDMFTFVTSDFWTDFAQSRKTAPVAEIARLFGRDQVAVAAPARVIASIDRGDDSGRQIR